MKVEELRQLSKAATPGPWATLPSEVDPGSWVWSTATGAALGLQRDPDSELIAAMRNHFDVLLVVAEAAAQLTELLADNPDFNPNVTWESFLENEFGVGFEEPIRSLRLALAWLDSQP